MHVLLISARRSAYTGESISAPHQGLLALAAVLREGTFHDTQGVLVEVLDDQLAVIDRPWEPPGSILRGRQADIVGVQTVASSLRNGRQLLAEARARFPHALLVLGGVGPTPLARDLVRDGAADVVVRGEGDFSFSSLVCQFGSEGRSCLASVPGISFLGDSGEVIETPPAPQIEPLDRLPVPARDLADMKLYRKISRGRSGNVITSRGCSYACSYCYSRHQWGVGQRRFSVSRVIDEIRSLVDGYGLDRVRIEDDDFLENRKWVTRFCEALIESGLASRVEWEAKARPDHLTEELAWLLRRAGCFRLLVGIETLNQTLLRQMNRTVKVQMLENAIRVLGAAGIGMQATMILGIPGETDAAMRETLIWLEQNLGGNPHDIISPCFFVPFNPLVADAMARRFDFRVEVQDPDCYTGHIPVTSSASCSIEELLTLYDDMQPDRRGKFERIAHLAGSAEVQGRVRDAGPVPLVPQVQ